MESSATTAIGRSATVESERERFDGRQSQFDPLQPFEFLNSCRSIDYFHSRATAVCPVLLFALSRSAYRLKFYAGCPLIFVWRVHHLLAHLRH